VTVLEHLSIIGRLLLLLAATANQICPD
jgi:hypothetical protein